MILLILNWILTLFWVAFDILAIFFLFIFFSDVKQIIEEATGMSFHTPGGVLFILFPITAIFTFTLLTYFNIAVYPKFLRSNDISAILSKKIFILIIIILVCLITLSIYQLVYFTESLNFSLKPLTGWVVNIIPLYFLQAVILLKLLWNKRKQLQND